LEHFCKKGFLEDILYLSFPEYQQFKSNSWTA